MSKFKFCLIGTMLLLGSTLFGAVTSSDTSTITLEAIKIPDITVENVDFGDYVIDDATPAPKKAAITLERGGAGRTVDLSLANNNITLLNKTDGSSTIGVALSINPAQVVLDGSGEGNSEMTVSLQDNPTVEGSYEGTAEVTVQYN